MPDDAVRKRVIREYNYNVHSSAPPPTRRITTTTVVRVLPLARVHRLTLCAPTACNIRDVLLDDELTDLFLLPLGCAAAELVRALLLHALVRLDEVAEHLRVRRGDHARVDVRARAEVVEDAGRDRGADEIEGFCSLEDETYE